MVPWHFLSDSSTYKVLTVHLLLAKRDWLFRFLSDYHHGCEPHYANDMHTIGRISSLDFTLHKAEKKIRSDSNFTEISPRLFSRELPFEIWTRWNAFFVHVNQLFKNTDAYLMKRYVFKLIYVSYGTCKVKL